MDIMERVKKVLVTKLAKRLPARLYSKLDREQRALLLAMQRDNSASHAPFTPSPLVWGWLNKNLLRQLHLDGASDPENSVLNHWFSAQLPGHRKYYFYALWNLYNRLKERDKFGIFDKVSPSGDDRHGVRMEIAGKHISWDYLLSAMSALTILENDSSYATDPKTILEIGAGWGRIGYFFRKLNPRIKYVAADIPGPLLISETYLTKLFLGEPHLVYAKARQLKRIGRAELPNAFSFVGTHHIPNISDNTIDLTINVASFQEMEPANVDLYFREINRISRLAYILERRVSDQTNFEHYIDLADKLDWRLLARREPEFAPNYEEALFERPTGQISS